MKTFFILEDDENRTELFNEIFKNRFGEDFVIFHSDNVEKAKAIFADNYPFDTIFLDHDLEHRVYVDSTEKNTGYAFACWMKENYKDSIEEQQVIVHSMNVVGAINIKSVLKKAILLSFDRLITVI